MAPSEDRLVYQFEAPIASVGAHDEEPEHLPIGSPHREDSRVLSPDFQTMMRPLLEIHADGSPHSRAEVRNLVAVTLGVSDEDRKILLPSGNLATFANQIE